MVVVREGYNTWRRGGSVMSLVPQAMTTLIVHQLQYTSVPLVPSCVEPDDDGNHESTGIMKRDDRIWDRAEVNSKRVNDQVAVTHPCRRRAAIPRLLASCAEDLLYRAEGVNAQDTSAHPPCHARAWAQTH